MPNILLLRSLLHNENGQLVMLGSQETPYRQDVVSRLRPAWGNNGGPRRDGGNKPRPQGDRDNRDRGEKPNRPPQEPKTTNDEPVQQNYNFNNIDDADLLL